MSGFDCLHHDGLFRLVFLHLILDFSLCLLFDLWRGLLCHLLGLGQLNLMLLQDLLVIFASLLVLLLAYLDLLLQRAHVHL